MSLTRRDFLLRSAAAASLVAWPRRAPWAAAKAADVIVVGAGLAGLHAALVLDGRPVAADAWKDHPRNPFPAELRELMPWQYTPRVMARANPLESLEDWFAPQHAAHDISALMMAFVAAFASAQRNLQPAVYKARDGNQRIPEGMAQRLKGGVRFGQAVIAVVDDGSGVTVHTADGNRHAARAVVCATPYSTLRDIRFEPALQGAQARAVTTLPHQMATQIAVVARRPFWDSDGWPPSMWTDSQIGRVFAIRRSGSDDEVVSLLVTAYGYKASFLDRLGTEGALAMS